MTAPCSHKGCGAVVYAKDLCAKHYSAVVVASGGKLVHAGTMKKILAVLPATRIEIIKKSGVSIEAVNRALQRLHPAGEIHIGDWQPPTTKGSKWREIYEEGPGEDAVLTTRMRNEQARKTRSRCKAKFELIKKTKALPKSIAWAAALMVSP